MASQVPPQKPVAPAANPQDVWDVELLHVHVSRKGQLVNAEWALHPQIKADLSAEEWKSVPADARATRHGAPGAT